MSGYMLEMRAQQTKSTHFMLISLLILVLSCPDMVMVYAFYVLLQGVLVNVIVNQNNTI